MNAKSIIKKVALALAGVAAITAVGFGVKAIVDYTKNDLKKISPTFEVGNLGSDGKYVNDESTLYTKEAFACAGLQVKPDFDSTVDYQIFYYDILDNYISSTDFMSEGYSNKAPVNGAYARIVIEPRDDEDGKISLTERVRYPSQLTIKVNKVQDVENRFVNFKGQLMEVVTDTDSLVFTNRLYFNPDTLTWETAQNKCVTSIVLLKVKGGSTLNYDSSKLGETHSKSYFKVSQFKDFPLEDNIISEVKGITSVLDKQTSYVIISVDTGGNNSWPSEVLSLLPSCFSVTKTK